MGEEIIQANNKNIKKILDVLDKDFVQAYADLQGLMVFIEEEAIKLGIVYKGKIVIKGVKDGIK